MHPLGQPVFGGQTRHHPLPPLQPVVHRVNLEDQFGPFRRMIAERGHDTPDEFGLKPLGRIVAQLIVVLHL